MRSWLLFDLTHDSESPPDESGLRGLLCAAMGLPAPGKPGVDRSLRDARVALSKC